MVMEMVETNPADFVFGAGRAERAELAEGEELQPAMVSATPARSIAIRRARTP
jgi:hypothetical protein